MTQVLESFTTDLPPTPAAASGAGQMLMRALAALDRAGVRYCVLHGYQTYPASVPSDVDLLVERSALPGRLARVLDDARAEIGGEIVQWLADGAHYIVLAGRDEAGQLHLLQLHATADYELQDRVFYSGAEVLDARRAHDGFWVPAVGHEFGCVLVNRVSKARLTDAHAARLAELYETDPAGCRAQAARFFSAASAATIAAAAESGDFAPVRQAVEVFRAELLDRSKTRQRGGIFRRRLGGALRRVSRWLRPPCGLHVVFLGPDGAGKSTVIDHAREHLAGAFLHTNYQTFAPSILPNKPKKSPHALPPRSYFASLLKAGWWLACYSVGYALATWPTLARSGLAINHRYMIDAVVDPKRYRYSGPTWLLRLIWRIVPKPHLIVLLDAPADVIWARKREVTPEETQRQCDAYRTIVGRERIARVVSADQPLEKTVADVEDAILTFLRARVARRRGLGVSA